MKNIKKLLQSHFVIPAPFFYILLGLLLFQFGFYFIFPYFWIYIYVTIFFLTICLLLLIEMYKRNKKTYKVFIFEPIVCMSCFTYLVIISVGFNFISISAILVTLLQSFPIEIQNVLSFFLFTLPYFSIPIFIFIGLVRSVFSDEPPTPRPTPSSTQ